MSNEQPEFSPLKTAALYPGWPQNKQDIQLRLRQLWNGEIALVQTFWIYYFIIFFVLTLLGEAHSPLSNFFNALAFLWAGFMVKPILAAAGKYPGDKIWAILAKIAAVVIAIAALSHLLNL